MSISPKPEVLVLTVNYERPDDTIECIHSLMQSIEIRLKFLIIDNGSRDESEKLIKNSCSNVLIERLEENTGFTGGFNYGIKTALKTGVEKILVTNNDTTYTPESIRELVNTPWDVSIPKILFFDQPNRIWSAGARWRKCPPSVVMRGYCKLDSPRYDIPVPLDYATGCVFLANRRVLEEVQGFDPEYKYYMEDYDFFHKVKTSGFTVGYTPTSRVFHKVSQTLGHLSPEQAFYMGRNTVFFYRKTRRFSSAQLWAFLIWVSMREISRGRVIYLKNFLSGAKQGFYMLHKRLANET
jgi:GT2 family glycosyltransferase